MAAVTVALEVGAPEAATRTGVPASTIYEWVKDAGGIVKLRELANEQAGYSMLTAKQAITIEMASRASDLPDGELAETFRAMLKDETVRLTQSAQGGQAGAAAQATIRVVLPGADGEDEVVDVPRTNVRRLPEGQEDDTPPPG